MTSGEKMRLGWAMHAGAMVGGCVMSVLIFICIPSLQKLIAIGVHKPPAARERKTLIEAVRKPEKKEHQSQRMHLRRVTEDQKVDHLADRAVGMMMKFTPDLSVEGAGGAEIAMQSQELAAEIFDENQIDEKPMPIYRPSVPYPQRANELGIEGTMQVEIVIDRRGNVESVAVLSSPHPSFSSEARRIISTWRFTPAKNKGIPVRVRVRQTIEFKLD